MEGEGGNEISGIVEGDYISPDRHAFTQEFGFAGISFSESYVVIGEDAWTRSGRGAWDATSSSDPEITDAVDLTSLDPDFFAFDDELVSDISVINGEDDVRNGIETSRIEISAEQFRMLGDLLGEDLFAGTDAEGIEELSMKVWLTRDEDSLVAVDVEAVVRPEALGDFPFDAPADGGVNLRMTFDLSRINDESIVIEPPI
jgi:hypothetical protein